MGEYKHLVLVKFKDTVDRASIDAYLKEQEKLVLEIGILIKSYVWGLVTEGLEFVTQGFTHTFLMTFDSMEDINTFVNDARHVELSKTFAVLAEKFICLNFLAIAAAIPGACSDTLP